MRRLPERNSRVLQVLASGPEPAPPARWEFQIHLRGLARAFFRLEVGVVTREAAQARHQAVRESEINVL